MSGLSSFLEMATAHTLGLGTNVWAKLQDCRPWPGEPTLRLIPARPCPACPLYTDRLTVCRWGRPECLANELKMPSVLWTGRPSRCRHQATRCPRASVYITPPQARCPRINELQRLRPRPTTRGCCCPPFHGVVLLRAAQVRAAQVRAAQVRAAQVRASG